MRFVHLHVLRQKWQRHTPNTASLQKASCMTPVICHTVWNQIECHTETDSHLGVSSKARCFRNLVVDPLLHQRTVSTQACLFFWQVHLSGM